MIFRNETSYEKINNIGIMISDNTHYHFIKYEPSTIDIRKINKANFNDTESENVEISINTVLFNTLNVVYEKTFNSEYFSIIKNELDEYYYFYYNSETEEYNLNNIIDVEKIVSVNCKKNKNNELLFNIVFVEDDILFISNYQFIDDEDIIIDDFYELDELVNLTNNEINNFEIDYCDLQLNNLNTLLIRKNNIIYSVISKYFSTINIENGNLNQYKSEKLNINIGQWNNNFNLFYDFIFYNEIRLNNDDNNIKTYAINYLTIGDYELNRFPFYSISIPCFNDNKEINLNNYTLESIYYKKNSGEIDNLIEKTNSDDIIEYGDSYKYYKIIDENLIYPINLKTYYFYDKNIELVQGDDINIIHNWFDDEVETLSDNSIKNVFGNYYIDYNINNDLSVNYYINDKEYTPPVVDLTCNDNENDSTVTNLSGQDFNLQRINYTEELSETVINQYDDTTSKNCIKLNSHVVNCSGIFNDTNSNFTLSFRLKLLNTTSTNEYIMYLDKYDTNEEFILSINYSTGEINLSINNFVNSDNNNYIIPINNIGSEKLSLFSIVINNNNEIKVYQDYNEIFQTNILYSIDMSIFYNFRLMSSFSPTNYNILNSNIYDINNYYKNLNEQNNTICDFRLFNDDLTESEHIDILEENEINKTPVCYLPLNDDKKSSKIKNIYGNDFYLETNDISELQNENTNFISNGEYFELSNEYQINIGNIFDSVNNEFSINFSIPTTDNYNIFKILSDNNSYFNLEYDYLNSQFIFKYYDFELSNLYNFQIDIPNNLKFKQYFIIIKNGIFRFYQENQIIYEDNIDISSLSSYNSDQQVDCYLSSFYGNGYSDYSFRQYNLKISNFKFFDYGISNEQIEAYLSNNFENNKYYNYDNYIYLINSQYSYYNKFVMINNEDILDDVLFVNLLQLFPEKFGSDKFNFYKIVESMETIYNGGMKNLDNDYINVLFSNIGKYYNDDLKLFYLYRTNLDAFFYDRNNLVFNNNIYLMFEEMDKYKNIHDIPKKYLYEFIKSFGLDYLFNQNLYEQLGYENDYVNSDTILTNIKNDNKLSEEYIRNSLNILRKINNYRGSFKFYEMILYIIGISIEINLQFLNKSNGFNNINNFESITNNVTMVINNTYFKDKKDYIQNVIDYLLNIIRTTIYLNRNFTGITYEHNFVVDKVLNSTIMKETFKEINITDVE